jgi:hypothetical protein
MGIETVAAIAAPLVIGAISKAMSDSNQSGVDAAQAKKNAMMGAEADKMNANRPAVNQSINNGMRQQSTAYQGANDMLASMGLGGNAPSGLGYNPMSNQFPQNEIPPAAKMANPTPEAAAHSAGLTGDSMKMRAAMLGPDSPPTQPPLAPNPQQPQGAAAGPMQTSPFAAALGKRP